MLVVDDDVLVIETASAMLEALGLKTVVADSGGQGIALLKEKMDRIDAVLMDVTMPELNGVEAALRMVELGFKKLIILSSGYSSVNVPDVLKKRVQFLKKPYRMDTLQKLLGKG